MIRHLAVCPYCGAGEVALDDSPALVFDPDGTRAPCPHTAWVDGRFSEWEHTPEGINRVIGSTEFRWDPPWEGSAERTEALLPYLKDLLTAGKGWVFAPSTPFEARTLNADQRSTAPDGKEFLLWDVDGWALYSANPEAFWAELPDCQERQLGELRFE